MNNQITIQKEKVLSAYNQASQEQKTLLENMFGKYMFQPKDITERIKTFKDACNALGDEHPLVKEYWGVVNVDLDITQDLIAYLKLRIISAALNEGWDPEFDREEYRYYPWFYIYPPKRYDAMSENEKIECRAIGSVKGFLYASSGIVDTQMEGFLSTSITYTSYRFAFNTQKLAEYCGRQFIDIWQDYLFA